MRYRKLMGAITAVAAAPIIAFIPSFTAAAGQDRNGVSSEGRGVSPAALDQYIEQDQPEFAVRIINERSGEFDAETVQSVYARALEYRLARGAEGAAMELLLHAPRAADHLRAPAARALVEHWRGDPDPTIRDLRRRLTWYDHLQRSIAPAPLESDLPVTLTLLALDHVDRIDEPADLYELLAIAERISPGDPLWTSYQPDDVYRLRVAESHERRGKYLQAEESYRRLIFETPARGDWFRRKLARTQTDRVTALNDLIGADAALQAAAVVRKDFLGSDELALFRIQEQSLYETVGAWPLKRRVPQTVIGRVNLESAPVSYVIDDETWVGDGATLTFGPGAVIQGGRLIVEGGAVEFNGHPDDPIVVIGVTFASVDERGGGVISGSNVHFRNCRWNRGGARPIDGGASWTMSRTLSAGCEWRFDDALALSWDESEFIDSLVMARPAERGAGDTASGDRGAAVAAQRFSVCQFTDGLVDQGIIFNSEMCGFRDARFEWTLNGELRPEDSSRIVARSHYEPVGGIPAIMNRTAPFSPGAGPIIFEPALAPPFIALGKVRRWVN